MNLAPSSATSPPAAYPLPLAPASPSAAHRGDPVLPALHAIFDELNQETGATAQGESVILTQISGAIRDQIDGLLKRAG